MPESRQTMMKTVPNLFYRCSWKQLICQRLRIKKIRKSILERNRNQKSLSVTMPLFSLAHDEGHVLMLSSLRSSLLNPLKGKWFSSKHPARSDSERRSGLWRGQLLEGVLQLQSIKHKTINITAAFDGRTSSSILFNNQHFSFITSKHKQKTAFGQGVQNLIENVYFLTTEKVQKYSDFLEIHALPHLYSTGSFTAKTINAIKDEDNVHISFERQNQYSNILEHTVN